MMNPDICGCCGEIWNNTNLKIINLGSRKLRLCPECYKEYNTIVFNAFEAGYHSGQSSMSQGRVAIKKAFSKWNNG